MGAVSLTDADLSPFAPDINATKAALMIEDAIATAAMVAPCIVDAELPQAQERAAKAIIRGALLRWHESGTGAIVSQAAGPFSTTIDTSKVRRSMFWPSEITDLQRVCQQYKRGRAFTIDTTPIVG